MNKVFKRSKKPDSNTFNDFDKQMISEGSSNKSEPTVESKTSTNIEKEINEIQSVNFIKVLKENIDDLINIKKSKLMTLERDLKFSEASLSKVLIVKKQKVINVVKSELVHLLNLKEGKENLEESNNSTKISEKNEEKEESEIEIKAEEINSNIEEEIIVDEEANDDEEIEEEADEEVLTFSSVSEEEAELDDDAE